MSKKIAVISDVHGNTLAFKEVLKDIEKRGIQKIYDLGDSLYGPFDPMGTFDLFVKYNIQSLSGNEDRIILENLDKNTDLPTLEHNKSLMTNESIQWLKSLPFSYVIDEEIYCCHGAPDCDTTYLLEDVQRGVANIRNDEEILDLLKNVPQKIILCGHSHVNNVVQIGDKTIINPGSVGLPAYDDEHPVFHKMECHNPMARYCVLELENGNIKRIEHIQLPYEHEASAKLASSNNREDWAEWARSGKA